MPPTQISDIMRDAAIAGMTIDDLKALDQGTRKAQADIQFMLDELKANSTEHASFMREIAKMQKAAAKETA